MDAKPDAKRSGRKLRVDRPKKVGLTLKVSESVYQRLGVHATMERRSVSSVVEQLVERGLTRFRVSDYGSADAKAGVDLARDES